MQHWNLGAQSQRHSMRLPRNDFNLNTENQTQTENERKHTSNSLRYGMFRQASWCKVKAQPENDQLIENRIALEPHWKLRHG